MQANTPGLTETLRARSRSAAIVSIYLWTGVLSAAISVEPRWTLQQLIVARRHLAWTCVAGPLGRVHDITRASFVN